MKKPIIGITMGDPASIGPEISVMALTDPKVLESCDPLSQALALTVKDSFQHFSLNLQPAGSGLRLDVSSFMVCE